MMLQLEETPVLWVIAHGMAHLDPKLSLSIQMSA